MHSGVLLLIATGLIGLSACTGKINPETSGPTEEITSTATAPVYATDWVKYVPGGETKCSDGSEFYLLTREGDPEKLVFFLEGGGGCSASGTCDPIGKPTYKMNLAEQTMPENGIFDLDNPDNPFADYSVVYVPYCTGDVHVGMNDAVYDREDGTQFTVYHRGRANTQAGLDYAVQNMSEAKEIFVTGVSAGAIPTPLYASYLADRFDAARIVAVGDGAGGYRYATPVASQITRWGMFNHINTIPGFEAFTPEDWSFERLYIQAGQVFPDMKLGRFDFAEDAAQSWFLGQNSENETLLENILQNNADITAEIPRFRSFIAASDGHVIFVRPGFFDLTADGRKLVDWLADFASHKPVDNVLCETCSMPEK